MARRGSGEEWTTLVVTEPRAPIFPVTSCWQLDQTASTTPWLFPGQEPARPLGATYLSLKLRQHGIDPLQAETVLASPWPPTCRHRSSRDFTGTSISNATRWTGYAKRDWLDYIASRKQD